MDENKEFAKKMATMTADSDPRGSRHIFYSSCSVFVEKDNKLLMVKENKYDMPDLAIDPPSSHTTWRDKTILDAARRAVKDETGYTTILTGLVGVYEVDVFERHYYHFVFSGEVDETEEVTEIADEHTVEVQWIDRENIHEIAPHMRSEALRVALRDYIEGKRYPLELLVNVGRTH